MGFNTLFVLICIFSHWFINLTYHTIWWRRSAPNWSNQGPGGFPSECGIKWGSQRIFYIAAVVGDEGKEKQEDEKDITGENSRVMRRHPYPDLTFSLALTFPSQYPFQTVSKLWLYYVWGPVSSAGIHTLARPPGIIGEYHMKSSTGAIIYKLFVRYGHSSAINHINAWVVARLIRLNSRKMLHRTEAEYQGSPGCSFLLIGSCPRRTIALNFTDIEIS